MTRIAKPQDISRLVSGHQPVDSGHDVRTRWIEWSALVLGYIGHHNHVVCAWGEASLLDEEVTDIFRIVDAAVQLIIGPGIVDTDEESLLARHDAV